MSPRGLKSNERDPRWDFVFGAASAFDLFGSLAPRPACSRRRIESFENSISHDFEIVFESINWATEETKKSFRVFKGLWIFEGYGQRLREGKEAWEAQERYRRAEWRPRALMIVIRTIKITALLLLIAVLKPDWVEAALLLWRSSR